MLYSEMQDLCQSALSWTDDEVTTYLVGVGSSGFINDAYLKMARRLGTNAPAELSGIALTAGTNGYVLATLLGVDPVRIEGLHISGNGVTRYPLERIDILEYQRRRSQFDTTVRDTPTAYVLDGASRILFDPTPGSGLTIGGNVLTRPTAMSSGGDTPAAIPQEYHQAICWLAISMGKRKDGVLDEADAYELKYKSDLQELRHDLKNRAGSPRPSRRPAEQYRDRGVETTWTRMTGDR